MTSIAIGTRVRIKRSCWRPRGESREGTVIGGGGDDLRVMMDGGVMCCTRNDVIITRDQTPLPEPKRISLPYGMWTCADGRQVMFNRDYRPIRQRSGPAEPWELADPREIVPFVREGWLYQGDNPPWRNRRTLARCQAALAGLPIALINEHVEPAQPRAARHTHVHAREGRR